MTEEADPDTKRLVCLAWLTSGILDQLSESSAFGSHTKLGVRFNLHVRCHKLGWLTISVA